jgi:predicted XRE-type DNA-binding protein
MATRKLRRSSGNVFRDLGFSKEESENLRIRSELMARLARLIEDRSLTQAEAAKIFGVSQPRVSDLVRGKMDLFSIDMLVVMLSKAGLQVSFTTRTRKRVA